MTRGPELIVDNTPTAEHNLRQFTPAQQTHAQEIEIFLKMHGHRIDNILVITEAGRGNFAAWASVEDEYGGIWGFVDCAKTVLIKELLNSKDNPPKPAKE
jgi:hypothetical protein